MCDGSGGCGEGVRGRLKCWLSNRWLAGSIAAAGLLVAGSQLFAEILILQADIAGDGKTTINVTGSPKEVATPLYKDFHGGTGQGDTWGGEGLTIGSETVTFTNVRVTDFAGSSDKGAAHFIGDGNGMGIKSVYFDGDDDSKEACERPWMIDANEGFTWQADKALRFESLAFRGGWMAHLGQKQLTISSPAWAGFKQLEAASDLGVGVRFDIRDGAGVFLVENIEGMDDTVTLKQLVGSTGVTLDLPAGATISFQNTGDPSNAEDYALANVVFSAMTE